jgi:hypothetical protein
LGAYLTIISKRKVWIIFIKNTKKFTKTPKKTTKKNIFNGFFGWVFIANPAARIR